jgi:hypothetical protein
VRAWLGLKEWDGAVRAKRSFAARKGWETRRRRAAYEASPEGQAVERIKQETLARFAATSPWEDLLKSGEFPLSEGTGKSPEMATLPP